MPYNIINLQLLMKLFHQLHNSAKNETQKKLFEFDVFRIHAQAKHLTTMYYDILLQH